MRSMRPASTPDIFASASAADAQRRCPRCAPAGTQRGPALDTRPALGRPVLVSRVSRSTGRRTRFIDYVGTSARARYSARYFADDASRPVDRRVPATRSRFRVGEEGGPASRPYAEYSWPCSSARLRAAFPRVAFPAPPDVHGEAERPSELPRERRTLSAREHACLSRLPRSRSNRAHAPHNGETCAEASSSLRCGEQVQQRSLQHTR